MFIWNECLSICIDVDECVFVATAIQNYERNLNIIYAYLKNIDPRIPYLRNLTTK